MHRSRSPILKTEDFAMLGKRCTSRIIPRAPALSNVTAERRLTTPDVLSTNRIHGRPRKVNGRADHGCARGQDRWQAASHSKPASVSLGSVICGRAKITAVQISILDCTQCTGLVADITTFRRVYCSISRWLLRPWGQLICDVLRVFPGQSHVSVAEGSAIGHQSDVLNR